MANGFWQIASGGWFWYQTYQITIEVNGKSQIKILGFKSAIYRQFKHEAEQDARNALAKAQIRVPADAELVDFGVTWTLLPFRFPLHRPIPPNPDIGAQRYLNKGLKGKKKKKKK